MAHSQVATFLVPFIFCMFGFIMAYFMRRGINIILFAVFLYAALKGLEQLKVSPDWKSFDKFIYLLQQLGRTTLQLVNNMVTSAESISIAVFLLGAVAGLTLSRRGA
jgi:hypothetical protein